MMTQPLAPSVRWYPARWLLSPLGWMAFFAGGSAHALGENDVNRAMGKPYTLVPPPNYSLTTDPDDARQLTDGHKGGAYWKSKATVGWQSASTPPQIVLDMGRVERVDEVRVHTVGGGKAGVFFPAHLLVMVSDDGDVFRAVGCASSVGLSQDRTGGELAQRTPHVFSLRDLRTEGRYVLVALEPDSTFVFIDEIEVFGSNVGIALPPVSTHRFRRTDVPGLFEIVRKRSALQADLDRLLERADPSEQIQLTEAASNIWRTIDSESPYSLEGCRKLDSAFDRLRGRWLSRHVAKPFTWTMADPMKQLRHEDLWSVLDQSGGAIEVDAWRGEYESAAVNVVNCGDESLRIGVDVSLLNRVGSPGRAAEGVITLRQAVFVEAQSIGWIGDALVKLGPTGMEIPPGEVGQVWMTVDTHSLEAGEYELAMRFSSSTPNRDKLVADSDLVPIRLRVHPIEVSSPATLNTCTWAYLSRAELTRDHIAEAQADLRAHYTNVFVIEPRGLPKPVFNANGSMNVDFTQFDAEIARYGGAKQFLFFWGLGKETQTLPELGPWGSEVWKSRTKQWLTAWVEHMQDRRIGFDRFMMYPYDETLCDEFFELAKFIKTEADPRIRIYANSRGDKGAVQMRRIAPYIDTWCLPDRPSLQVDSALLGVGENVSRWTYAADGPGKANDPLTYYRLQPWRAFARSESGCGFWAYTDKEPGSAQVWNDFARSAGWYGVIYGSEGCPVDSLGEAIIPSRRWEAWREGVEDYEYLSRLQGLILNAKAGGVNEEAVAKAAAVLKNAVEVVLKPGSDSRVIDRIRSDISSMIVEMERDRPL